MKAKRSFSKILPFDQWREQTNPTEGQIALYHQITAAIKVAEAKATPKKLTTTKRTHHASTERK